MIDYIDLILSNIDLIAAGLALWAAPSPLKLLAFLRQLKAARGVKK